MSGGGLRLSAPMEDQPRPLRPVRAKQGKAGVLSPRRLGDAGRGVVWRANQGPRASPAQRNGGPSGRRNAFRWESRSSGADEACRLRQDEGCAACDGDGRGRARERSAFSPSGGNRVKRTLRGRCRAPHKKAVPYRYGGRPKAAPTKPPQKMWVGAACGRPPDHAAAGTRPGAAAPVSRTAAPRPPPCPGAGPRRRRWGRTPGSPA